MTLEQLTVFFGWCALINIVILCLAALVIIMFRGPIMRLHSTMTGVETAKLPALYFKYLGNYKIATLVLSVVPYLALRIAC